jgi:hypothetical protein
MCSTVQIGARAPIPSRPDVTDCRQQRHAKDGLAAVHPTIRMKLHQCKKSMFVFVLRHLPQLSTFLVFSPRPDPHLSTTIAAFRRQSLLSALAITSRCCPVLLPARQKYVIALRFCAMAGKSPAIRDPCTRRARLKEFKANQTLLHSRASSEPQLSRSMPPEASLPYKPTSSSPLSMAASTQ